MCLVLETRWHYNEAKFGLMDYKARYYSPYLGRFISPDPIVPEPTSSSGFNRYRYARNNPLKYTDPSGYCGISFGGNSDVMQQECIDVGGGGAGPVIIAAAATVAVTQLAVEAGKALGEVILPQGRPVQRPTTSGGYANGQSVDKELVVGEGVSLDGADGLDSTPHIPPKIGVTNPPGTSLTEPGDIWDGVLSASGPTIGPRWKKHPVTDPRCQTGCENVAGQIQKLIGGDIYELTPDESLAPNAGSLGPIDGHNRGWHYHQVVVSEGRVYDAFTESEGQPVKEYRSRWEYDDAIKWTKK